MEVKKSDIIEAFDLKFNWLTNAYDEYSSHVYDFKVIELNDIDLYHWLQSEDLDDIKADEEKIERRRRIQKYLRRTKL